MASFDFSKGSQPLSGIPQHQSQPDGEFLPRYEEAVNANLRNFDQLEGQVSKGGSAENAQQPEQKVAKWKRALLFSVPLIFVLIAVMGAGLAVFEKHQDHQPAPSHTAAPSQSEPELEAISTSITLTKRHTATITYTYTHTVPAPPSIALAISSFYASWKSSVAASLLENAEPTIAPPSRIPLPDVPMQTSSPAPSIESQPAAPAPEPISAAPTTTSSIPTTVSTYTRSGPTGDGFCGLPGTFCANGKRDTNGEDRPRVSVTIVTIWKTLSFTTTTTTTDTVPPFPASVMDEYDSYLNQGKDSVFSAAASFTNSVLYSMASFTTITTTTTMKSSPSPSIYCAPAAPHVMGCQTTTVS